MGIFAENVGDSQKSITRAHTCLLKGSIILYNLSVYVVFFIYYSKKKKKTKHYTRKENIL